MAKKLSLEESILKEFGAKVLISGCDILERKDIVISVSPKLDMILGGGIPEGTRVILTGQPKYGKSSLALHFASQCQKPEFGGEFCPDGRHVYYYNVEGRLQSRDISGIPGLNPKRFTTIQSEPGNILTGEKYLQIADILINNIPGSVHIIDSYSALCTEAELTSGMEQMQRADGAKLLAKFCRKIANVVPINKNIVVGVTHLMGNPTGYGKAFKEKSGQAIAYHFDVKLQALARRPLIDKNEQQIGQEVDWQCLGSPIGPPGKKTTSYIRYGYGIDILQELLSVACDIGIIQKGGAWYTLSFLKDEPKIQGMENTYNAIIENKDWFKQLNGRVQEFLTGKV